MITANVRPGDLEAVKYRLDSISGKVKTRLAIALETEAVNLVSVIKMKLSDNVLHVRTGRLRRSITYKMAQDGPNAFRVTVGTNVVYARAQEYGFRGTVNVKTHMVKEHQRKQTIAFGKLMKEPRTVTVKAHSVPAHAMKMNLTAHPFIRPALEENASRITENIRKALMEAIR